MVPNREKKTSKHELVKKIGTWRIVSQKKPFQLHGRAERKKKAKQRQNGWIKIRRNLGIGLNYKPRGESFSSSFQVLKNQLHRKSIKIYQNSPPHGVFLLSWEKRKREGKEKESKRKNKERR